MKKTYTSLLLAGVLMAMTGCDNGSTTPPIKFPAVINIAAIGGVTAPVTGETPVTAVTPTAQYTGTVTWSPAVSGTFAADTQYTAAITVTAKEDFTLKGVAANFFTVAGTSQAATNAANTGVITAVFPKTAPAPAYGITLDTIGTHTFTAATFGYTTAPTALTVTVTNSGNQATGELSAALSGANSGDFTLSKTSINSIAVSGNDTFTVVPNTGLAAGDTYIATVTVSGSNSITADFNVSFTVSPAGTPIYGITLDKTGTHTFTAATFGYTAPTALTVTVTNSGNQATGELSAAMSGANSGDFTLSKISISSIAVNGTDTFTVVPKTGLAAGGTYTATVTVSGSNGITANFNVSFTVNPAPTYGITLSATGTHTFTAATFGYTTAPTALTVTVTNSGNQATDALTAALSGANSGDFTLSKTSINSIAVSGNDTFTVVPKTGLAAGDTYIATVTVSGSNGITADFNVSFTVSPAGTPIYGITLDKTGTHTFTAATFGYTAPTALTVTVTNSGNQATGELSAAMSGANSGDFTLSKISISNIAVSGSDTFTVVPKTGLAAGAHTATVTVSGSNSITADFNVSFTVSPAGTPIYGITLDKTGTHTFTAATFGYTAPAALTVTVTNSGNQATGSLTAALSGANSGDFTLSKTSITSIAVSGNDTFTVVPKTGLAVGAHTATVTVSGSNSITANFNVSFTVNPAPTYGISLSATGTHTFTAVTFGYTTAPTALTVTVTNSGNQATGSLTAALSGANSGDFTLSKTSITSIAVSGNDTFTVVPKTGLAAGNTHTAAVTVSGTNITSQTFNVSFTVNPKVTTFTVEAIAAQTYNGSAHTPTVTVKDGAATLALTTDYTVAYANNTNAGTATVTVTGAGNYAGSTGSRTFTVNPKVMTFTVEAITAQTYNGSAHTPAVTVKDGAATLALNTDYTVVYNNNTNAGTATAAVTGAGNYAGSTGSRTFTVNPKVMTFTVEAIAAQTYNGSAHTPTVTIKDGATTLALTTDYTAAYANNTNAGTATAAITGAGNYAGSTGSRTFTVNPKVITFTVEAIAAQTYNGSAHTPTVTVKDGAATLALTAAYTVAYANNTNAGTAAVTVTGAGNYAGSTGSGTFTINPIQVSFNALTADGSATTVTTAKLTLTFDKDITGLAAGDITLTANGTGAAKGTLTRTGTGVYELALSGISASGTVSVAAAKTNYTVANSPKTAGVYAVGAMSSPITVNIWVNEADGNILASNNDFALSRSGSGGLATNFTAAVNGGYSNIQWKILGTEIPGSGGQQSITINAADYVIGRHRLNVVVYKNGVPYSTEIIFTVQN